MNYHPILKRLQFWFKSQHFGRSSVDSRYALIEACLIGALSGLAAILVKTGIGAVGGLRVHTAEIFGAGWILPPTGLILGFATGYLLQEWAPSASGGGIPQVKAALARYPITLSFRVAWVKAVGTILVLGAGFTLGRRAPTVHIGAALASWLSQCLPTSPEHRRQMIAAGAAAGLAAGFNTPIAGVLFVIEELMRDASGLTLETAVLASFTGSIVSRLLGAAPISIAPIIDHEAISNHFSLHELPIFMLLGTLAGVLGAYFNRGILWNIQFNRRLKLSLPWQIGLAGLISGSVIALLPPFFRDNAGLREVLVIGEVTNLEILIAFIAHFFLTMLAYSSGAPGGLFAPALVMGSSLGYLVGVVFAEDHASLYALAGMGAFFTGIVRVPVTATVIVFEMTADFNLVLPLMVTCAIAYVVAESVFSRSIYDHLLLSNGIELKENLSRTDFLSQLTAAQVMQSKVETLSSELTLDEVKLRMSLSHHRGFPVVSSEGLVGIITQSDLDNQKPLSSPDKRLKDFMTLNPITVKPITPLSDVLYLLNRYRLSRLPVTDGVVLVGIITRSDIIRAEVRELSGVVEGLTPRSASYLVYRTQSPSPGKSRLLVLIHSPAKDLQLFALANALAHQQELELDCLQVFLVSRNRLLSQTPVSVFYKSRHLMQRLEDLARDDGLTIHTQTRLAYSISDAVLDSCQLDANHLLVMETLENVELDQINCPTVRVKFGTVALSKTCTWLIPLTEQTEIVLLLNLLAPLLSLVTLKESLTIYICAILTPNQQETKSLSSVVQFLNSLSKAIVVPICLKADSLKAGVKDFIADHSCDLIVLNTEDETILPKLDVTLIFWRC